MVIVPLLFRSRDRNTESAEMDPRRYASHTLRCSSRRMSTIFFFVPVEKPWLYCAWTDDHEEATMAVPPQARGTVADRTTATDRAPATVRFRLPREVVEITLRSMVKVTIQAMQRRIPAQGCGRFCSSSLLGCCCHAMPSPKRYLFDDDADVTQ